MIKLILRVLSVLVVIAWLGGIWFTGKSVEERLRLLLRDDPSNIVEVVFDPFAEPEIEPLLKDRVWLSMLDYRRTYLASIARLNLHLRLGPEEEPVLIPLLVKFHHGPIIFAGGPAIGAARVQITLDYDAERRFMPPRWGREAKPIEGKVITRGVLAFDGSFEGRSWIQQLVLDSPVAQLQLERMRFAIATDDALSEVLIEGDMDDLVGTYRGDDIRIEKADMSLRANSVLSKDRYEGVLSVNWRDAELNFREQGRHVAEMSFDTEYRLINRKLDAEVDVSAEQISSQAEEPEDRELVLDYGEAVAAIGEFPIERVLELWDSYRFWEPATAALSYAPVADANWRNASVMMKRVSSNVSAYASLKFGMDQQELLMRANAEFIGDDTVERLDQVSTIGELFNYLLADLTYQADGRLAKIPEVEKALSIGRDMDMLEMDEYGPSGSVHIRAGEVRVNGRSLSPDAFLQGYFNQPLWPPVIKRVPPPIQNSAKPH